LKQIDGQQTEKKDPRAGSQYRASFEESAGYRKTQHEGQAGDRQRISEEGQYDRGHRNLMAWRDRIASPTCCNPAPGIKFLNRDIGRTSRLARPDEISRSNFDG
jgi:hypothetical protein